MYTVFSEVLRTSLMSASLFLKKIASGGFEYQNTYFDQNENKLMVKYKHNNKSGEEEYSKFIHSCYFNMLTAKEAKRLLLDIIQYEKTKKTFEIVQDDLVPELFDVKNTMFNKSEAMLLKDIINDNLLLENMPASHIRTVIKTYSALNKEEELGGGQRSNGSLEHNPNIIPFNKKKSEE